MEQTLAQFSDVEILLMHGNTIIEARKKIEVADQTYYNQRENDGSMRIEQVKPLKSLEKQNSQLKKLTGGISLG